MNKKKVFITTGSIISFLLIIILGMVIANNYSRNNNKNNNVNTKEVMGYLLPTKILFVDKEKTAEDIKLDEVFKDNYDSIISMQENMLLLKKNEEYFEIDLNDYVNKDILNTIVSSEFALNDIYGHRIEDANFDKTTKVIKIPTKYYDEKNSAPVQVELVSRISKIDFKNINVNLIVNNKKKNIELNSFDQVVSFSIMEYNKKNKLTKNDIELYVNNSNALDSSVYNFDQKTGVISFDYYPVFVNDIKVNIKNQNIISKALSNIVNSFTAFAVTEVPLSSISSNYTNGNVIMLDSAPVGVYEGQRITANLHIISNENSAYNATYIPYGYIKLNSDYGYTYDFVWNNIVNPSINFGENGYNQVYKFVNDGTVGQHFKADLDTITSGSVSIPIPEGVYLFQCAHITVAANNLWNANRDYPNVPFYIYVIDYDETNRHMTLMFMSTEANTIASQSIQSIYSFTWPQEVKNGQIKVTKRISDEKGFQRTVTSSDPNFNFDLYEGTTCQGTPINRGSTSNRGVLTFKNLDITKTYSVKESLGSASSVYEPSSSCTAVSSFPATATNDVYEVQVNVTNKVKKYCFKVKKVDETGAPVQGAVFSRYSGFTSTNLTDMNCTTGSDGICTVSNLTLQSSSVPLYVFIETSAPSGYWLDDWSDNNWRPGPTVVYPDTYAVSLSGATEMTYNTSTHSYSCPSNAAVITKTDHKKYYCAKVKKADSNNPSTLLTGATFNTTINGVSTNVVDNTDGTNDGVYSFFFGNKSGTYTITETAAPAGYNIDTTSKQITTIELPEGLTEAQARAECYKTNGKTSDGSQIVASALTFTNSKSIINWYKELQIANTPGVGAKFSVKDSNNSTVYHEASKVSVTDSNNVTKSCYKYSSTSTGSNSNVFESDSNGEVCITGLNGNLTYTITETEPPKGYTFGSYKTIKLSGTGNFVQTKTRTSSGNTLINYDTVYEFTKSTYSSLSGSLTFNNTTVNDFLKNKLNSIDFNIYDSNNNIINFTSSNGVYKYSSSSGSGTTTNLKVNSNNKITVKNLPIGNYKIKESASSKCTTGLGSDCYGFGFYLPSESSFTVTSDYNSTAISSMQNVLTELKFTKSDLYSYENAADIVRFENNEEISAFDNIGFKIKDSNGKYLNVYSLGNSGQCTSINSYSRYVFDPTNSGNGNTGTVMYTCGGNIKIYGLCRNTTYTIEEVSVPDGTVFTLPTPHPTVSYKIPETGNTTTNSNNNAVISDVPTRVVFQKKDTRNTTDIINDQSAEFEVYRCAKGTTTCTKSTAAEQIHFIDKTTVDNEQAYKAISSSDLSNTTGVTSLKLNTDGKIVIRYLPAGYYYVFVEKKAPKGFYDVTDSLNLVFTVSSNSTNSLYNFNDYPTSIKFTKSDIYDYYNNSDRSEIDSNSKEFDKIKFRLYDSSGNLVSLTKVQNGEYRYYNGSGSATGNVNDLNTKDGDLTITHLNRNTTYYLEEYNADGSKVFILPNNINNSSLPGNLKNNKHPIVSYSISNNTSTATPQAVTAMIANKPTRVVFKKIDLNTSQIVPDINKVATFKVYQCQIGTNCTESNGTLIYFEDATIINNDSEDIIDGSARKAYKYSKLNSSTGAVSELKLDNGYLVLRYLPTDYNYVLVETVAPNGYYNPPSTEKYTSFTVLSTTLDNGDTYALPNDVNNTPIELTFTKEDFYKYIDENDSVRFENMNEVKAFDSISFQIKDANNQVLSLCKEADQIVGGKSISVYSYLNSNCDNRVNTISTKNGSLKISYLYRATTYTVEEVSVPTNSIFALPDIKPSVTYNISTEGNVQTNAANKKVISNVPTRVLIYKKDDRTNSNIREGSNKIEAATFEVYRCASNVESCTKANSLSKVTFMKRAVLTASDSANDNNITDMDLGREAYKFVTTSDLSSMSNSQKANLTTTTLELDNNGQILLKYLPADFKYVLVETNAPDGYYDYSVDSANAEVSMEVTSSGTTGTVYNFVNTHTKIKFNKKDIYDNENIADEVFDTMKFVLRDEKGNVVNVTKVQDGEYRFIQTDGTYSSNNVSVLNTKDGELIVTHLYRNKTYYIEEIESDPEGMFILPNNINNSSIIKNAVTNSVFKNSKHPVVRYELTNEVPTVTELESLTQLIENRPTRVVFEKKDALSGELIDNNDVTFNLYKCDRNVDNCTIDNGILVRFDDRIYNLDFTNDITSIDNPIYNYRYSNSLNGEIVDLHTDRGVLILSYLPSGYKYVLYETHSCDGYYTPTKVEAQTEFEVKSTTIETGEIYEELTSIVTNTPTEIFFVKSDIYDYYSDSDVSMLDEETKLFDTMKFVVRDSDGNILSLKCTENGRVVRTFGSCKTGEYRYLPTDNRNYLQEINTVNGRFKVTHLENGKTYYVEEVKSDNEGVFILPNYITYDYDLPFNNYGHPVVRYDLPVNVPETNESVTSIIENTPTRVVIEKRDSVYGYLITDETTTFNVYMCDKNEETCTKENGTLVNFEARGVIPNDAEDSNKEVYKFSKLNEKKSNTVTDIHPYNGELILRYLPSNYKYVLVETISPTQYILPSGDNANTIFEVNEETVIVDSVDVPNKPTSLLIRKYSDDGELLEGAEFAIYEGLTCDKNLSAKNQPKERLSLRTIRDGIYENSGIKDTNTIKTCIDKDDYKCNDMTSSLTLDTYVDTWTNFENSINQYNEKIEIQPGEALIQYLEYGHCYIIEEVKAPKGYSLPENDEDRFMMVTIEMEDDVVDTYKELINKPTPFTFYKYNDYNELIDGGVFKLQKLNSDYIYEDVTVTEYKKDNSDRKYYKVDKNSTLTDMQTLNGTTTIYYLEEGQYRVVEIKAPAGMELPNKELNVSTFYVSKSGVVKGSNVIANKPKTAKIEVVPTSSAEFIVNIATGKSLVKFGLIIGALITTIISMLAFVRITKKNN